jgi:DNA-directed RNA polymerase specialized sigma24 family protein
MTPEGSVTRWIDLLKTGDGEAAQKLWERYFERLVGLARNKIQSARPRAQDEEDVALSAFDTFFRGVREGRFPHLDDRDNLWRILVVLTARKAALLVRDESRQKRGGEHRIVTETTRAHDDDSAIDLVLSREPTPEFAAQIAEECQRLLRLLGNPELEQYALWKMEGYSNEEIAARAGCTPRTVFRKLGIIRGLWEKELAP